MVAYVGNGKILTKVPRYEVAFWAQKAVQEFRENQGGTNLKAIAEKYNLNEIELENALAEEPNEGNAFAVARLKAIKAGED